MPPSHKERKAHIRRAISSSLSLSLVLSVYVCVCRLCLFVSVQNNNIISIHDAQKCMEQKINKYEHRSGTTTNNNTNSVRVFAFSPPSPSPLHFLFNNLPLLSISLLYSLQRAAITFLFLLKTTKI